jgi:hypothetical protein
LKLFEIYNKKFSKQTVSEGGAMPGVGAIHISEIEPTLSKLEKSLGIKLKDFTLGSVGKRKFSGDIDVAINLKPEDLPAFAEKLSKDPNVLDVQKSSVFMTKVKIENFDKEKSDGRPRTGFVQIDFMPGDPGWMKTYYHSPTEEESKYKGVFRNLLLASIAGQLDRKSSDETTEDGRPLQQDRWMFSPRDGLIRVRRTPVQNKAGTGYTKKNNNKIISKPNRDGESITKALKLNSVADLNSYESLKAAIEKNYPADLVKRILKDFVSNPTVQDIGIPGDLK